MIVPAILASTVSASAMVMAEGATTGIFNGITADSFASITAGISEAVPLALPVAITVLGIRKGVSMLFGLIRGA